MPGAVTDLGRFTDYATVLGSAVADPATLAAAMTLGVKWRELRNASEAWDTYVKAQDGIAWRDAFILIDEVRPIFQFALVKQPSLAVTYPKLAQVFNAAKGAAKHAVATKAKKAKAAQATAAAAVKVETDAAAANVATATAAASAAADAANKVVAATVATPPKAVTVNA
jgi:hypothetical protein